MTYSNTSALRKRIVFLGTPTVAAATLERLSAVSKEANFELPAVVTRPPAPSGRRRTLTRSPVHERALQLNIKEVLTPASAREPGFLQRMREIRPHLCVTAAYGNFLPQAFLDIPEYGTLNIHPSLLPQFRGAAPVSRALQAGVTETGVSVAFTVLKMDSGPIVAQPRIKLNGDEQAPELLSSLFALGTEHLISVLPSIWDRTVTCTEQEEAEHSHAPKISKDEARLTFVENAKIVHNKVRAFAGWPGTWADFEIFHSPTEKEELRLKVLKTSVLRPTGGMCLGVHDVSFDEDEQCLALTCDDGSVVGAHIVQPLGKNAMNAKSFWNGLRGKRLGRKRVPH